MLSKLRASCLHCDSVLSHRSSISNLKKHVLKRHPDVDMTGVTLPLKAAEENGSDDFTWEEDPVANDARESIEWEEENSREKEDSREKKETREKKESREKKECRENGAGTKRRRPSSPARGRSQKKSNTARVKRKAGGGSELFGRYLASLLGTLPERRRFRVQAQLISLVVEAQDEIVAAGGTLRQPELTKEDSDASYDDVKHDDSDDDTRQSPERKKLVLRGCAGRGTRHQRRPSPVRVFTRSAPPLEEAATREECALFGRFVGARMGGLTRRERGRLQATLVTLLAESEERSEATLDVLGELQQSGRKLDDS